MAVEEIRPRLIVNVDNEKECWICFTSAKDDRNAQWVKPCRCCGSLKWVHQNCLQKWVFPLQEGPISIRNDGKCRHCKTEYLIAYRSPPFWITIFKKLELEILKEDNGIFLISYLVGGVVYMQLDFQFEGWHAW